MAYQRAGVAFAFALAISACASETTPNRDEVWQTIEGCDGNELCSFATLATDEYNKQASKPGRNGYSIRGAETDGRVVSVALNIPASFKDEPVRAGRTVQQQMTDAIRTDLCRKRTTRRFFDLGGEFRLSTYLPSGEQFSKNNITSC